MGQHVSKRTGKTKVAYTFETDAQAQCGPGENCYVCDVCGEYHVGHELRFRGSMRAQLNAALERRARQKLQLP